MIDSILLIHGWANISQQINWSYKGIFFKIILYIKFFTTVTGLRQPVGAITLLQIVCSKPDNCPD